jgi:hypothetical protein
MSRPKRRSRFLANAKVRAAGLKSIDPSLDVGNCLTLPSYNKLIGEFEVALDVYNTALSNLDRLNNLVNDLERKLREVSEQMLSGVACKYGKNSYEYEMAGGTRRSKRKSSPTPPVDPEQPLPAI